MGGPLINFEDVSGVSYDLEDFFCQIDSAVTLASGESAIGNHSPTVRIGWQFRYSVFSCELTIGESEIGSVR